jgi:hypothetical protein
MGMVFAVLCKLRREGAWPRRRIHPAKGSATASPACSQLPAMNDDDKTIIDIPTNRLRNHAVPSLARANLPPSAATKTGPDSVLDSLRAQSEALRMQGEAIRRPYEEALQEIDRRLMRTFRWLDEALSHLQVIRPVVEHHFRLGNVLTIERPRYESGFVNFRKRAIGGHELIEHVDMFYKLAGDHPVVLRVSPGGAAQIDERLRTSSMPYRYQTEHDERRIVRYGVFTVTPAISASVRFQPDYQRQVIEVTLCNVDRFESVSLEFVPDKFDEAALDDLLKFVLGKSTTFLRRAPLAGFKARRDAPPAPARRLAP